MNDNNITIFAETTFRNQTRQFGIKADDRRRHMYLIGKTGMGKSNMLEHMIIEDIRAGRGVAVVDPHGDLAENVINYVPSERINDVIYFNPADMEYPIAFNVVEQVEPHLRHLVASGLIGVFQKLWADSWGPRLEYILRNSILAVLDYPGSTLLAVTRILSDKAFRKKVVANIQDPVVKAFWVNEFAGYADKFAAEAVSPIQNKVGQFLSSSLIRNIVGQVKSTIDMREVMDSGKILIMNLSKGRIGEDNSALLGAMMITKIQLAAMSRVNIPEKERKDFYLYIDEFQNFMTDSFADILSEARKYRLNLVMAHQYIEQMIDKVKAAVFGNVGTLIVFRVGSADAEALVPEFAPTFSEIDIVNLPKFEFYIKLMIDGIASDPFSGRGLLPLPEEDRAGNTEKVVNVSRERYAKKREIVEEKILRWHENTEEDKKAAGAKPDRKRAGEPPGRQTYPHATGISSRQIPSTAPFYPKDIPAAGKRGIGTGESQGGDIYKNETVCSRCGQRTRVSFVPDGIRPVFCKDCLTLAREEKREEVELRKRLKAEELQRLEEPGQQRVSAAADRQSVATSRRSDTHEAGHDSPRTANRNSAEISLADALSRTPVDFKGKPQESYEYQRPVPPKIPGMENGDANGRDASESSQGKLKQGEGVKITQHGT